MQTDRLAATHTYQKSRSSWRTRIKMQTLRISQ